MSLASVPSGRGRGRVEVWGPEFRGKDSGYGLVPQTLMMIQYSQVEEYHEGFRSGNHGGAKAT